MKHWWPVWLGWKEVVVVTTFLVVLCLPLLFDRRQVVQVGDGRTLVIMTPHNEQIRYEFETGFEAWHQEMYDEEVDVVWSIPGGTSEIRRMLQSQWNAALKEGYQPGGDADLVFGGGSYEHGVLARGVSATRHGLSEADVRAWCAGMGYELMDGPMPTEPIMLGHVEASMVPDAEGTYSLHASASISASPPLEPSILTDVYGREEVAGTPLWDSDGHWFGTALSSFGLIANHDELKRRDLPPPTQWADLADPRLRSAVSMVNPGQSGSVTTAFETVLKRLGWTPGWQILRRAAANARTISASSARGPADVAMGDAAMGVCIDFYGRYQQQALADQGAEGRLIYVDPPGETTLDPDPISMLANPNDAELASRFMVYTLTEDGQSLWQFSPQEAAASEGPTGPSRFALRRLPIRADMYQKYFDRFMDQVDPFANAEPPEYPDRAMRAFIAPLMQAMAIDERDGLEAAWTAIVTHPAYPKDVRGIVSSDDVDDPQLAAMIQAFDAMPLVTDPEGHEWALDSPEGRDVVKKGWLRGGWSDAEPPLWPSEAAPPAAFRRFSGMFFRDQFNEVLDHRTQP